MKKRKFILAVCLALSLAAVFAACSNSKDKDTAPPPQLDVPVNLQISGSDLTWDAVDNAAGYYVQLNNNNPINNGDLTACSLDGFPVGAYSLRVQAIGDGKNYGNSDWSAKISIAVDSNGNIIIVVKLSAPVNLKISGSTLTWDEVPNAVSYSVQINGGTPVDNGDFTTYQLASLGYGTYTVKVQAKGGGTAYIDSDWTSITYTAPNAGQ